MVYREGLYFAALVGVGWSRDGIFRKRFPEVRMAMFRGGMGTSLPTCDVCVQVVPEEGMAEC